MMANKLKVISLVIVCLLISLVVLSPVSTAQAQGTATLTGKGFVDVNIRANPGTGGGVIGVLPANAEFIAIGRTEGNNWIQIQYQGTTGWVASWLLTFSGDTNLLPQTSSLQPPLSGVPGPFEVLAPFNVNLRSSPQVDGNLVAVMSYNTVGQAVARTASSSWVKVVYNGYEGWVAAWLVVIRGDVNHLPADGELTVVTNPTVTPIPTVTSEPGDDDDDEDTEIRDLINIDVPPGTVTARAPFRVNLRSAPTSDADVLGLLGLGQAATVVGRNAGYNWLLIEYGDQQAWVANWVVTTSDEITNVPVVSDTAAVQVNNGFVNVFGTFDLIVRTGPGESFYRREVLPAATSVPAVARTADNSWIKISFMANEGWVAGWLVVASADINNLPIEDAP